MSLDKATELAIFEEIRNDLVVKDGSEFFVPLAKVFGKGTVAKVESFGGRSLAENAQRVDLAIANSKDLQNIWNRSHTQWMWKHLNLSYLDPHKNMRQIAAEIARKRQALNEAKWNQVRTEMKIRKIEEQLSVVETLDYWTEVELKVKLAEHQEKLAEGMSYVEGAMKDILALDDLFEQLKEKTKDFSEMEIERAESKAHLKRSVVQCIRDVRQSGSITKGEQEYLEQIGINPMRMMLKIREYVAYEAKQESWDVAPLHKFVDEIADELIDVCKVDQIRLALMGFDSEPLTDIAFDKMIEARKDSD
jgi:uncharacterized protein (DUF934 family)